MSDFVFTVSCSFFSLSPPQQVDQTTNPHDMNKAKMSLRMFKQHLWIHYLLFLCTLNKQPLSSSCLNTHKHKKNFSPFFVSFGLRNWSQNNRCLLNGKFSWNKIRNLTQSMHFGKPFLIATTMTIQWKRWTSVCVF